MILSLLWIIVWCVVVLDFVYFNFQIFVFIKVIINYCLRCNIILLILFVVIIKLKRLGIVRKRKFEIVFFLLWNKQFLGRGNSIMYINN